MYSIDYALIAVVLLFIPIEQAMSGINVLLLSIIAFMFIVYFFVYVIVLFMNIVESLMIIIECIMMRIVFSMKKMNVFRMPLNPFW